MDVIGKFEVFRINGAVVVRMFPIPQYDDQSGPDFVQHVLMPNEAIALGDRLVASAMEARGENPVD
jgi:hypothetical protein